MPRIWKRIKKYERWFLLAIVIIVLATFSVSGQCSPDRADRDPSGGRDVGGSYEAAQGKRETVSSEEFLRVRMRYGNVHQVSMWGPSLRWADELFAADPNKERLSIDMATWAHIATVGAARAAGYEVGPDEVRAGIRKFVERVTQRQDGRGGRPFSPELYEQVLAQLFRGSRTDFEATVGEILLKDKYLAPWVDGARFSRDRDEAFAAWKAEKERVDLEFAAVPAAQFAERVKLEEETRSTVARQTTALENLVTAKFEIGRIAGVVEAAKVAANGVLPKDTAALLASEVGKKSLNGKMPLDPWGKPAEGSKPKEPGNPYVYVATGESFTITSFGPDRKEGTPDDVTRATVAIVDSLTGLRRTADALVAWRNTTENWPTALPELTKVPPPAAGKKVAPPPLATLPKDSWDREFVYEPAGPVLLSLGADGQRATPDDLVTTITSDRSTVAVPAALAPFIADGLKDAWGVAIDVQLGHANPVRFEARSAGPDGKFATADDVFEGNELDLLTFYNRVRMDYRLPERRHFEALYVIPCLVPDETFAAAWAKFAEFRPDEQAAFDFFRGMKGSSYTTSKKGEGAAPDVDIDPADPKEGNGAALVEALRANGAIPKDGKVSLVPAATTFGEQANPATPKAGQPDSGADPIWKLYVDKGWRRVVLRDLFLEKLINDSLTKCRTASDAKKAWEKSGRTGPEPATVTFESELARYKEFSPGSVDSSQGARFIDYFATKPDAPLSREEWEKLPELGDVNTSEGLKRLKEGDYAAIPTLLRHDGTIHAAFHVSKIEPTREPEIDEVRAKVFPAYLEARSLERAAKELESIPSKLKEKDSQLAAVVGVVAKERDFTFTTGRTGPFVGSLAARRALTPEDGASDDVKAEFRRRNYVRRYGYDVVKNLGSQQDATTSAAGTVGRRILRDDDKGDESTRSAYLVRVAWSADPSPEEFHAKDYARWLSTSVGTGNIYANEGRVSQRSGTIAKQLGRVFDDWDEIKHLFVIETHSNIEMPMPKKSR